MSDFDRSENSTSAFLGNRFAWSKIKIELDDVQPLHGGVRVYLPGWTTGQAIVTRVASGGKETKYKILLWKNEKDQLCQLCVDHDFLTIAPENRRWLPDEARPSITLTNRAGEQHRVTKWAGVKDARFDAIYEALRQIGEQSKGKKPIPKRLRPYQKGLFILGLALLVAAVLSSAYRAAGVIVTSWWPAYPSRLVGLVTLFIIGLPLALIGLRWWENNRSRAYRMGAEPIYLFLINLLILVGLVTLPTFLVRTGLLLWGETAVAQIQTLSPTTSFDSDAGWLERYQVTYTFQLESGSERTRRMKISQDYFETLTEGDTAVVYYFLIFPRYSQLEKSVTDNDYVRMLVFAILAIYLLILGAGLGGKTIVQFVDERF